MALNARQKRFVDEYLIDLNATQAAIRSGYSEKTAYSIGFENLKKPDIQAAIHSAQKKLAERNEITQDSLIKELEEARARAMENNQFSASVAATMGKAKIANLLTDKVEHSGGLAVTQIKRIIVDPTN